MLIIGCGNRQRGDDAAGIIAGERLRALGIAVELCAGEASELMEIWTGAEDVIVIDAVVTSAPVGSIHVWDGRPPLGRDKSCRSTHGLGVAEAIELARALDSLPPKLRVFGIEGQKFALGSAMSPEVERAVEEIVSRIVGEVNAAQ